MMTLRPYRMFFALALALSYSAAGVYWALAASAPQMIPALASAAAQFACLLLMHLFPRRGNVITALQLCFFLGARARNRRCEHTGA